MNKRMKNKAFYCVLLVSGLLALNTQLVPQEKQELFLADPTIYVENGKYYLTGTGGSGKGASAGFAVLESTDVKTCTLPTGAQGSMDMILCKGEQAIGAEGYRA